MTKGPAGEGSPGGAFEPTRDRRPEGTRPGGDSSRRGPYGTLKTRRSARQVRPPEGGLEARRQGREQSRGDIARPGRRAGSVRRVGHRLECAARRWPDSPALFESGHAFAPGGNRDGAARQPPHSRAGYVPLGTYPAWMRLVSAKSPVRVGNTVVFTTRLRPASDAPRTAVTFSMTCFICAGTSPTAGLLLLGARELRYSVTESGRTDRPSGKSRMT